MSCTQLRLLSIVDAVPSQPGILPAAFPLTSITRTLLPCTRPREGTAREEIEHMQGQRPDRTARHANTPAVPHAAMQAALLHQTSICRATHAASRHNAVSLTMAAGGRFFWNLARTVPMLPWARVTCERRAAAAAAAGRQQAAGRAGMKCTRAAAEWCLGCCCQK